jgi:hypothetical protein
MKKKKYFALTMLIFFAIPVFGGQPANTRGSNSIISAGITIGYDIGMPVQGHLLISNFAEDFPLSVRLVIGHTFMWDPGTPLDVRHVFINENNNGVPQKSASRWELGIDLLHHVKLLSLKRAFVYGGVHYSHLTGSFDFVGGNEFFDVYSNQWGLAAGLDNYFRVSSDIDLFISVGTVYFFPSTLKAHDSEYSPNGQIINQRENYTYSDADRAVNQPKLIPKLLVGLNYYF